MVDFNQLNTIEDIKKQLFGGSNLTDPEKNAIFGHSDIGGDVAKARQVAVFLESVKSALKKLSGDTVLLNTLKSKSKTSLEYKAINSYNTLVDNAINHLEALEGDAPIDKTEAELQTELNNKKAALAKEEKELEDKKKEIDDYARDIAAVNRLNLKKAQKKREAIDGMIDYLTKSGVYVASGDIVGTKILDHIVAKNREIIDFSYDSNNLYKTSLD